MLLVNNHVCGNDSAVLSIPASETVLQSDLQNVFAELSSLGLEAKMGSVSVSHKPTINSNNGG